MNYVCFIVSFILGFALCASIHHFLMREIRDVVTELDDKYRRILEVLQMWQKKI